MKQIGIIGPETKNIPAQERDRILSCARKVGECVAKNKAILITGGCTGVVEAALKGAISEGGITVGTPGRQRGSSVLGVTVEICTPIDVGDFIFAGILSSDAIIVFPGDAGTLAELAIAYRYKKPLIFIKDFGDDWLEKLSLKTENYPRYIANNAEDAVSTALAIAEEKLYKQKLPEESI